MKDLVTTLKAQHRTISHLISRVDEAIEAQDGVALRVHLEPLKTLLLTHLEMEDRELYPALMTGSRRNPDTVSTARMFSENMCRISEGASAFFRRHSGPELDVAAFAREWRSLAGIIAGRCESEESSLYPHYEKMARIGPEPVEAIRQAS